MIHQCFWHFLNSISSLSSAHHGIAKNSCPELLPSYPKYSIIFSFFSLCLGCLLPPPLFPYFWVIFSFKFCSYVSSFVIPSDIERVLLFFKISLTVWIHLVSRVSALPILIHFHSGILSCFITQCCTNRSAYIF